jgi:hypothetical protein
MARYGLLDSDMATPGVGATVVNCGTEFVGTSCEWYKMAFVTKGWRRLVADDAVYYWQPDELPWSVELFRVRPEREPHRLLRVRCPGCGPRSGLGRAKPGLVRAAIAWAINESWLEERPNLGSVGIGDPVRFVCLQANWCTTTVHALARGIEKEIAFDRMPILADALQDAGCDSADMLDHCRGPGPHVRGCWVVDLILGKQ